MKTHRTTALIGKAALHLACFHLARLGHDFTITRENSKTGDLWVNFGAGIEVVEVKGMTKSAWHLRADQISRVSRVIFVMVDDGACWMVHAPAVIDYLGDKPQRNLTIKQAAALGGVAMHKQVGRVAPVRPRPATAASGKSGRVVRRRLADGTEKVYRYGPYERPIYNDQQHDKATA
jgi:hypothetical protein